MFLRSRLETIAQGIRAVDTASSHSLSPSMGFSSYKEEGGKECEETDVTANAATMIKTTKVLY